MLWSECYLIVGRTESLYLEQRPRDEVEILKRGVN
jgi:hypothetical protein